ncbi:leucine-rich repeat-containing protein 31 [Xenopus laevis]|uniref:Leucine-rich repeat-containing protein 31 n=2 Tax=Xenopus laevis TaxID=8355 RepID=A0A974CVN7_XENLA|nr:leucine-rich repeat-containing protein 31 [Xenopus laevis]OCT80789.1 hypothetical protein XELAEV_18027601mg [Xenopus laevis]
MDSKDESKKKQEANKPKRSPFDLIFNQIQKKKVTKESNESNFQVKEFFRGFERNSSKGQKKKEEEELKNQSKTDDHNKENGQNEVLNKEEKSASDEARWIQVTEFMQKFGKKAECYSINLNNCSLTQTDLNDLGVHLSFLPDVEEIDLSWNNLIGGSIKQLTPHFRHVAKLKLLCLSNCSLIAEDASALGEALEYIPHLEALDLSWNSDIGGNLSKVTQHIPAKCELKMLNLTECGLGETDGEALATAIRKMPHLEALDLSLNKHIGSIMNSLVVELKSCSSIRVLNLHATGLHQDNIQYLSAIFQYWPNLRVLDLSSNKEAGGGFREAAARLTAFKHLERLDIHQCSLSQDDVNALTQVIPLLSNLEVLDISSNKAVGLSPEYLFSRLRFLPKLKSVLINNCGLKEESFAALAEASHYLLDLNVLDLSWNKCVGGKLKLLLGTLKTATALQRMVLSSCNLVTQDLAVLASAAQAGHLDSLKQLDIAYNDTVPDEGWMLFFESAHVLKNITELDVSLPPSSHRSCGPWFIHLLSILVKLPKLRELGMQRWLLTAAEKQQLSHIMTEKNISILFD